MADQKLVTISEAAEILGVSVDTLRRWDKSGKLSPAKTSDAGYRLYSRSRIGCRANTSEDSNVLDIKHSVEPFRGCLALITF